MMYMLMKISVEFYCKNVSKENSPFFLLLLCFNFQNLHLSCIFIIECNNKLYCLLKFFHFHRRQGKKLIASELNFKN